VSQEIVIYQKLLHGGRAVRSRLPGSARSLEIVGDSASRPVVGDVRARSMMDAEVSNRVECRWTDACLERPLGCSEARPSRPSGVTSARYVVARSVA